MLTNVNSRILRGIVLHKQGPLNITVRLYEVVCTSGKWKFSAFLRIQGGGGGWWRPFAPISFPPFLFFFLFFLSLTLSFTFSLSLSLSLHFLMAVGGSRPPPPPGSAPGRPVVSSLASWQSWIWVIQSFHSLSIIILVLNMYTCELEYGHSVRQADYWCETSSAQIVRQTFEARTECPTRTFCADKIRTDRPLSIDL